MADFLTKMCQFYQFFRKFSLSQHFTFILFAQIEMNCLEGHVNKQNKPRVFKIGSVDPEINCLQLTKTSFREKRV